MGVFSKIVNKFKFSEVSPLDDKGLLSKGDYGDGRVALLKKGKVIDDNLKAFSGNLVYPIKQNASKELLLAKTQDGDFKVYFSNGDVFIDSINNPSDTDVLVTYEDNICIVDYEDGLSQFVIVPELMFISEDLSFVDEIGADGLRFVSQKKFDEDFQLSYYVDNEFKVVSPSFVEEQDVGEYKILTILDKDGLKNIICDNTYKVLSQAYEEINYVDGKFIANNKNGETFLIDEKGDALTKDLANYHIFRNGCVLAEESGKNATKLIDGNNETVEIVREPIVDKNAGVIAGFVGGRYVMFGYDYQDRYEVDEHVAKLIIDKLQGKKLASQYVTYVLDNEIDMKPTMEAYEKIVKANFEKDPTNEVLQDLGENARTKFILALDKVSSDRVKRTQKQIEQMQEESARILSKAALVRKKQGKASKFNSKINETEEEKE